jgi:hypothetical protein
MPEIEKIYASQMIIVLTRLIKRKGDMPVIIRNGQQYIPPKRTRVVDTTDKGKPTGTAVLIE